MFAHFLCVHTLVFVVAAQMCNRACMCCVSVHVCVQELVCAPEIQICMTGGQLGSPNLPSLCLPPSFYVATLARSRAQEETCVMSPAGAHPAHGVTPYCRL